MRSLSESTIRGIGKSGRSTSSQVSSRPLPLKQRTSSIDTRRDYSWQTVISLIGLIKLREYFITVDNFSIWRRHLAWAMPDGDQLRSYMTQRFASSMVFMSLLLGAELNVLFNSAAVTTSMRRELFAESFWTIEFWAGIAILISVILTLLSLISTFTAWYVQEMCVFALECCTLTFSLLGVEGEWYPQCRTPMPIVSSEAPSANMRPSCQGDSLLQLCMHSWSG